MLHNLRKEFRNAVKTRMCGKREDSPVVAVRNTSVSVEKGQVFGLLGPNGAGKSTTLKCIIAEELPSAGTVSEK